MKDLLLVVPSRGRPASIARLIDAMTVTCRGDTTLLVGLDLDDPELLTYGEVIDQRPRWAGIIVQAGLRQVVAWINKLAVPATADYRFIGTIGDDNVPLTDGWDVRIMEALSKTPFAFGNDLYPYRAPGELCCHVFCRSEVIAALGFFGPPALRHSYVDDVWMAWGKACGITYLDDVIIEHLHHTAGTAPADETYVRSMALMGADQGAFTAYCRDSLTADVAKIRAVIG